MHQATSHRLREKATGRVFWIQRRVGFRGIEFDAGGGWRGSVGDAITAARNSGGLTYAQAQEAGQ